MSVIVALRGVKRPVGMIPDRNELYVIGDAVLVMLYFVTV
jgi:hypothetical protein